MKVNPKIHLVRENMGENNKELLWLFARLVFT